MFLIICFIGYDGNQVRFIDFTHLILVFFINFTLYILSSVQFAHCQVLTVLQHTAVLTLPF